MSPSPTASPRSRRTEEAQRSSLAGLLCLALLALWLGVAPVQFTGLTSGDYNFWPQSLALLLLGGVALLASVAGLRVRLEPVGACLLAFLGWNFLSTLTAVYAHDAWLELARLTGLVTVFFACRALRERLDWLALASVAGAFVVAIGAILDFSRSHNTAQFGGFANPNLFAALLAPTLWLSPLVALWVWRRAHSAALALVGLAPFVCLALALALTSSKGGFLSAVVATLVFILALARAQGGAVRMLVRRTWPLLLVLLLVFGAVGAKTVGPRLLSARTAQDNSTQFRAYTWHGTLLMARAKPLTGFGPGAFATAFPGFALAGYTREAHQTWLQIAAESGWPALLLLMGAFIFGVRAAWRQLRTRHWARGACGLSALGAVVVHGFVDSGWFTIAVGATLFVALALCIPDDEQAPDSTTRGLSLPFVGATLVLLLAGYGTQRAALGENGRAAVENALTQNQPVEPQALDEAVALDPGSARLWNFAGRVAPIEGRPAWEGAFQKAMQLQPDNNSHPRAFAAKLADVPAPTSADLKKTGELYDHAVELDPLNSGLRLERGKWRLEHKDGRGFDDFEFVVREWDEPFGRFPAIGRDMDVNLDFARATLALAPHLRAQGQSARAQTLAKRALADCAAARALLGANAALIPAHRRGGFLSNFDDLDSLDNGLRAIR